MGDLTRFIDAQEGVWETALAEIEDGRKMTHWMWFILPQLRGLGASAMAQRYGVADLAEARAYLAHPVLGPRLVACVRAALTNKDRSALEIFGPVDEMKFRSCLTLFAAVDPADATFGEALTFFFRGIPDSRTLELLTAKH